MPFFSSRERSFWSIFPNAFESSFKVFYFFPKQFYVFRLGGFLQIGHNLYQPVKEELKKPVKIKFFRFCPLVISISFIRIEPAPDTRFNPSDIFHSG